MNEILNVAEPATKYDKQELVKLFVIIKNFIVSAFEDNSFKNSNTDTKFKYIHEFTHFFNSNLADKWYVSWNKYWAATFKNQWMHSTIEILTVAPFTAINVRGEDVIQKLGYAAIMEKLYSIFPYMKNLEELEEDDEPDQKVEKEDENKESDSIRMVNIARLIPRKKKIKVHCKRKISFLHAIMEESNNIEPSFTLSEIDEVHNKSKTGSIFFINIRADLYNKETLAKETISICGYEEYDYIGSDHDRFHIRNQFYKKCRYIIETLAEEKLPTAEYPLAENYSNTDECIIVDVKEGGNLNFYKFIKFWKTLRS